MSKKISELSQANSFAVDDLFAMVDLSSGETKKINANVFAPFTIEIDSSLTRNDGSGELTFGDNVNVNSKLNVGSPSGSISDLNIGDGGVFSDGNIIANSFSVTSTDTNPAYFAGGHLNERVEINSNNLGYMTIDWHNETGVQTARIDNNGDALFISKVEIGLPSVDTSALNVGFSGIWTDGDIDTDGDITLTGNITTDGNATINASQTIDTPALVVKGASNYQFYFYSEPITGEVTLSGTDASGFNTIILKPSIGLGVFNGSIEINSPTTISYDLNVGTGGIWTGGDLSVGGTLTLASDTINPQITTASGRMRIGSANSSNTLEYSNNQLYPSVYDANNIKLGFSANYCFSEIWGIDIYATGDLSVGGSTINFSNLPTSSSGLSTGDLWNDSGTLKIV